MRVRIEYPTEGTEDVIEVDIEPGETVVEAIQARGDAAYEFIVLEVSY